MKSIHFSIGESMCIKPEPYVYDCPSCGWSKYISPKSDALSPADIFIFCPECHCNTLNRKPATLPFSTAGALLKNLFY
jgi:Zn finger protein HypA/HybF involved in hydrogenase expression